MLIRPSTRGLAQCFTDKRPVARRHHEHGHQPFSCSVNKHRGAQKDAETLAYAITALFTLAIYSDRTIGYLWCFKYLSEFVDCSFNVILRPLGHGVD